METKKLTKRKAIQICRDLWRWLAETGDDDKANWPGWRKVGRMECDCPCCEYADRLEKNEDYATCQKVCPLIALWPDGCCETNSPYFKWFSTSPSKLLLPVNKKSKRRIKYAKMIADHCDELLVKRKK